MQSHDYIPLCANANACYGLATVMLVPLLSPSGSWLADESYVSEPCVTPLTVKVTVLFFLWILLFSTEHVPELSVMHEPVPDAPLLQLPLTVALETGL